MFIYENFIRKINSILPKLAKNVVKWNVFTVYTWLSYGFGLREGGQKKKDFVLINNNILFSYLNSHADILLFFSLLLLIIFFTLFLSKAHSSSSFVHLSLVSKRKGQIYLIAVAVDPVLAFFYTDIHYMSLIFWSQNHLGSVSENFSSDI